MTLLSGARFRAGFGHYRHQFAYNVRDPARAGNPPRRSQGPHRRTPRQRDVPPRRPRSAKSRARSCPSRALRTSRQPIAVIHPVAATPAKTWPAANFLELAAHLRIRRPRPGLHRRPADDLTPFAARPSSPSLADLKALLARAALFVGNDSGPAHMAAAFGLPVVVLFGPSDREIWGPWRTVNQVLPLTAAPGAGHRSACRA